MAIIERVQDESVEVGWIIQDSIAKLRMWIFYFKANGKLLKGF